MPKQIIRPAFLPLCSMLDLSIFWNFTLEYLNLYAFATQKGRLYIKTVRLTDKTKFTYSWLQLILANPSIPDLIDSFLQNSVQHMFQIAIVQTLLLQNVFGVESYVNKRNAIWILDVLNQYLGHNFESF